jgi:hypothetical protein
VEAAMLLLAEVAVQVEQDKQHPALVNLEQVEQENNGLMEIIMQAAVVEELKVEVLTAKEVLAAEVLVMAQMAQTVLAAVVEEILRALQQAETVALEL